MAIARPDWSKKTEFQHVCSIKSYRVLAKFSLTYKAKTLGFRTVAGVPFFLNFPKDTSLELQTPQRCLRVSIELECLPYL